MVKFSDKSNNKLNDMNLYLGDIIHNYYFNFSFCFLTKLKDINNIKLDIQKEELKK